MAAQGAHLLGRHHDGDAQGGDAHRRARPQGDHRGWRVPARAPAPGAGRGCRKAQARRACGAHALRRRRRDLHRRPFLHPVVRLPVADRQAEPRSAAHRPGDHRDRQLRGLRTVRRGRPCGGAVPVILPRRADPQSELVGSRRRSMAVSRHRSIGRPRSERHRMSARPISVLIAALGGEGGGVLTDWIIAAAANCDLPVQSTSIPGVAQRTGATTYYIEIYPTPWRELGGKRPVLALAPGIGDVDMVVASEFLEAGRAIAGGFVTPDRTLLIASTHRSHAIAEKMAMGDGRFDTARLTGAVDKNARSHVLFDMDAAATAARAMINSVMLGAIAASGRLPIPAAAFEAAIRAGKSADANLRGFRAGFEAAAAAPGTVSSPSPRLPSGRLRPSEPAIGPAEGGTRWTGYGEGRGEGAFPQARTWGEAPSPILSPQAGRGAACGDLELEAARFGAAADIVSEGRRRLTPYQDISYARLHPDPLAPIAETDARAGAQGPPTREA